MNDSFCGIIAGIENAGHETNGLEVSHYEMVSRHWTYTHFAQHFDIQLVPDEYIT